MPRDVQEVEVIANRTLDARALHLSVIASASLAAAVIWGAQRYITALDDMSDAVNALSIKTEVLTTEVKFLQQEVSYLKVATKERGS